MGWVRVLPSIAFPDHVEPVMLSVRFLGAHDVPVPGSHVLDQLLNRVDVSHLLVIGGTKRQSLPSHQLAPGSENGHGDRR